MAQLNFSGAELTKIAVRIEENGIQFYSTLAEKADSPQTAELFRTLAGEERKHAETFRSFTGVSFPEPIFRVFDDSVIEEENRYLESFADVSVFTDSDAGAAMARKVKTPLEAIESAIATEKDSILFYYTLRDFMADKAKDLLNTIIGEEKKHILRLTKIKITL